MFPSLRIARIHGIDLFIHWTFWLLPAWIVLTWEDSGMLPLWMHMVLIAALFVCIVLHEFGHALTAQYFGIRTRSITLSPLGGIAQLEKMSQKPLEEFCIAIAGPLVNVAIAGLLLLGLAGGMALLPVDPWQSGPGRFLIVLFFLNVGLVVFNMVPAFPMDGGRVLRAVLAGWLGLLQGTRVAVGVGTFIAISMGLIGAFVLGNPWLMLIAFFVIWAGQQELRALELEASSPPGQMKMTIWIWDSRHGMWVRRTLPDSMSASGHEGSPAARAS